jgi:dTDP-4-amino-4,6-dideoxygalactose transaminase
MVTKSAPLALLTPDATVREALAAIEKATPKLGLVVDAAGRLERTVSDGDVRRGLLSGCSLSSPVNDLPGRQPVTAPADASDDHLLSVMSGAAVETVVLLDADGRPCGLRRASDITGQILLSSPHLGEAEAVYVRQAFDTNWIAPAGPNLDAFEARLATISDRKHAVAVASGTAGLHLALRALDLAEGARVYVSDKTFAASLQPILYERMVPVLIDSEPETWNMSPEALERRLARDAAAGRLPGAIILVHLYGQPAQLRRILPVAQSYGVPIIEDAAESLGAIYENRPSGAHGLVSVFSFNGNKIITTSGGGAVVTDDAGIASRIRFLSTQGRDPYDHYQHSHIAFNYRMSNILAGVGLGQLEVLADRVARRREIHDRYRSALAGIAGLNFQGEAAGSIGNRWLTVIDLDPARVAIHPYQLMRMLQARGVETRPSWKPMHMQPLCDGIEFEPHGEDRVVSSDLFLRGLCLPSGSNMTDAQQDRIIANLVEILEREKV